MEAGPFFFLNFKGTPSQEVQKPIFRALRIDDMALSDKIYFSAFFHLWKMTYQNFISSGKPQTAVAFSP
jgi:hypothetical protein